MRWWVLDAWLFSVATFLGFCFPFNTDTVPVPHLIIKHKSYLELIHFYLVTLLHTLNLCVFLLSYSKVGYAYKGKIK